MEKVSSSLILMWNKAIAEPCWNVFTSSTSFCAAPDRSSWWGKKEKSAALEICQRLEADDVLLCRSFVRSFYLQFHVCWLINMDNGAELGKPEAKGGIHAWAGLCLNPLFDALYPFPPLKEKKEWKRERNQYDGISITPCCGGWWMAAPLASIPKGGDRNASLSNVAITRWDLSSKSDAAARPTDERTNERTNGRTDDELMICTVQQPHPIHGIHQNR